MTTSSASNVSLLKDCFFVLHVIMSHEHVPNGWELAVVEIPSIYHCGKWFTPYPFFSFLFSCIFTLIKYLLTEKNNKVTFTQSSNIALHLFGKYNSRKIILINTSHFAGTVINHLKWKTEKRLLTWKELCLKVFFWLIPQ